MNKPKPWLNYQAGRFLYRGNAVAAGGNFFPVQASSSLPTIGGTSTGQVHDYRAPGPIELQIGECYTNAGGSFNHRTGVHGTQVTARVSDMRLDAFHARELDATLVSLHKKDLDRYPFITMALANEFVFRIHDTRFHITLCTDLMNMGRREEFETAYSKSTFREKHAHRFYQAGRRLMSLQSEETIPDFDGYLMYSVVDEIAVEHPCKEVSIEGNVIHYHGFGSIFLGEVYRNHHAVRFNLLRFVLDHKIRKPIEVSKFEGSAEIITPVMAVEEEDLSARVKLEAVVVGMEINGSEIGP
jgi:hypothetical protein